MDAINFYVANYYKMNNDFNKNKQPFVKFYKAKKYFLIKYSRYCSDKINQSGGAYPKKVKIVVKNKTYKFVYQRGDNDNKHLYMLYDDKDNERCVMIFIDEQEENAVIENINGDYQACPNGSKLLESTIKFLKEYASDLKIKRIVLADNSMKKCFGKSIKFSDMYSLLYGITWYASRGFLPYDQDKRSIDKDLLKIHNRNKDIIGSTYVKDVINLEKYLVKYGKINSNSAKNIINKFKDKTIYKFFHNILKNYDELTCTLFYNIYQKVMYDLNIQSMYGRTFFMEV